MGFITSHILVTGAYQTFTHKMCEMVIKHLQSQVTTRLMYRVVTLWTVKIEKNVAKGELLLH